MTYADVGAGIDLYAVAAYARVVGISAHVTSNETTVSYFFGDVLCVYWPEGHVQLCNVTEANYEGALRHVTHTLTRSRALLVGPRM